MAKAKQSLADQIHAALRIAEDGSTTVGEAEAAMLTAQRLAAKHFGGLENVPPESAGKDGVLFLSLEGGLVVTHWRSRLLAVITGNFRCRMLEFHQSAISLFTKKRVEVKRLCIVGNEEDAKIAFRVFMYAMTIAENELLRYLLAQHWTPEATYADRKAAGESWCEGFVSGVKLKFQTQVKRSPSLALMVIIPDEVEQAIADAKPDAVRHETDDPQANYHFFDGWSKGRNIGDGNVEIGDSDGATGRYPCHSDRGEDNVNRRGTREAGV